MDNEHESLLARILAERERRGDLLDKRSITGRQAVIDQTREDIRYEEMSRQRRRQQQEQQQELQQQAPSYASSPHPTSAFDTRSLPASPVVSAVKMNPPQADQQKQQVPAYSVPAAPEQNQQQQAYGNARPLPVLGQSNTSTANNNNQRNNHSRDVNTHQDPFNNQQQQQHSASSASFNDVNNNNNNGAGSLIQKGKFINFSKAPMLEIKDTSKIRSYAKGEAPAHREIVFQDDKILTRMNAAGKSTSINNNNNSASYGGSESKDPNGMMMATPNSAARSGSMLNIGSAQSQNKNQPPGSSYAPLSHQRNPHPGFTPVGGARSVSQQRYPTGATNASPSVAQLASSAKANHGRGNANTAGGEAMKNALRDTRREMDQNQGSLRNPFRTQTFDEFQHNPDTRVVPVEILEILREAKNVTAGSGSKHNAPVWNHKAQQLAAPHEGATSQPIIGKPLFDFNSACRLLLKGDYFLKWKENTVHRRFFRVSEDGELFVWAKTSESPLLLSTVIRISDIASIEPSCVVDEVSAQTVYVMTIWSTTRVVQLGTEYREKFDIWFETLRVLTQKHRNQNHAFVSRHATMVPKEQTAAATSMTARQGMMGGRISSSD